MLGEDVWPPAVEFYDFLKILDAQEANAAHQQSPEGEEADEDDVNVDDEAASDSSSSSSSAPDVDRNAHSEL